MRGSRRSGLFQRQPTRLGSSLTHTSTISQTAQSDVKLLRAKSRGTNFSQILQLKKDIAVCALAIAVNHCLALFIVFGKGPGTDALNVARAESWTAVCIEHVAAPGFVQHRPDCQAFTQLPAAAVQHSTAARELSRLTLITRAFSQIVDRLLARYFKPDCFKSQIHDCPKTGNRIRSNYY